MSYPGHDADVAVEPADYELVYECLRFARDNFIDDKGTRFGAFDREHLQRVVDRLEELLTLNATTA